VITPLLPNGYPDINLAKEITGMSVRTLQRRLGEEGLTYTQVVEKIRFEQAVLWLQEPSRGGVGASVLGVWTRKHQEIEQN